MSNSIMIKPLMITNGKRTEVEGARVCRPENGKKAKIPIMGRPGRDRTAQNVAFQDSRILDKARTGDSATRLYAPWRTPPLRYGRRVEIGLEGCAFHDNGIVKMGRVAWGCVTGKPPLSENTEI
jgi:hypothetical protein